MKLIGFLIFTWFLNWIGIAEARPKVRVASLSVAADEILVALTKSSDPLSSPTDCAFEIAGLSALATSPQYSHIATEAAQFQLIRADAESILKTKPDIVIVTPFNSATVIAQLQSLKIRALSLERFDTVQDILENIRRVGDAAQCRNAAEKLAQETSRSLQIQAVNDPRPILLAWNDSLLLPGSETLIDDIITRAGGTNILATQGFRKWTKISAEKLALKQPDMILVAGSIQDQPAILKHLQNSACCKNMRAVKTKQVYTIEPRVFSAASHHIVELYQSVRDSLRSFEQQKIQPPAAQ